LWVLGQIDEALPLADCALTDAIECVQRAKFPIVGFVGPMPGSRRCMSPSGRGRTSSMSAKVATGFNRKSSMEIRKKLDAIVSSKSRLVKAPRLKGASWVLRADR
jgi:bifunctional non-homologous end joining protein LigD